MRAEVDELIPRKYGGSQYTRANTRLTHRICNQRRGDGGRAPQPTTNRDDYRTSRDW